MRILCLHGRGFNNEIFQLQLASLRNDLDDFSFEFVRGTFPHTEGNWSLYTTSFSKLPLYTYYNPLVPSTILEVEEDILKYVEEEGPFAGVIGYSGGAALTGQAIIRHSLENPWTGPESRPFRFAVFINGSTPLKAFRLSEVELEDGVFQASELEKEAAAIYLRRSNVRIRKGEDPDVAAASAAAKQAEFSALQTRKLADRRLYMTDGKTGVTRYDSIIDGPLIDIPTLHVRCPADHDPNGGLDLTKLCESSVMTEYYHRYGHDSPRGHMGMKKIAQLIRDVSDMA
ncbi:hypothetical protein AOQ84DRAFT_387884 [Glonium stellatum]|uniref:Serine hydrolase domain-containing protein n=1 Tax=Glonium stellatum TaxID=574774 RepID=A0A8E2F3X5_9PEZI|nr:hypothetical protein AOQ84DRAFT_387884 [Glonium stellatum]